MFKNLFNKFRKKKDGDGRIKKLTELNQALYPANNLKLVAEEINRYKIKGEMFHLGDKVICRSNECDPLMVGEIVEFWNNDGKWDNCIPQVKDENGQVWGVMGHIKHHTDELMETLKPMRALEQWNYFIPDELSRYRYSEEQMDKKEKQYNRVQERKRANKNKVN